MKHHGQIVEYIIRRSGYNLCDLAKALNVNRRTLYNWFNQTRLRSDIIFRIGKIIRHNFSVEFPELFLPYQFDIIQKPSFIKHQPGVDNSWKDKYLDLLEKYNNELLKTIYTLDKKYEIFIIGTVCSFWQ